MGGWRPSALPRGTCYPCRCGARGGGLPFWSPAATAFSLFVCPHPPDPLPGGKGGTKGYFMQGASPLASPWLNPRGTGRWGRTTRPEVGLSPAALAISAAVVPEGGLPFWSPAAPAFSLPSCPHPPNPLPPRGRGGILLYFAGGSAPGTPGIKPLAALTEPAKQVPGATESPRFAAKTAGSGSL